VSERQLKEISLDEIEALAVGAWILGTAGGSPISACSTCAGSTRWHRPANVPLDLDDHDWVAWSQHGCAAVGQERLADSRSIARAWHQENSTASPSVP